MNLIHLLFSCQLQAVIFPTTVFLTIKVHVNPKDFFGLTFLSWLCLKIWYPIPASGWSSWMTIHWKEIPHSQVLRPVAPLVIWQIWKFRVKVAHLPVKNCDSVIFHSKLLTVRRIPSPLDTSSEFSTYLGPFRGCFIYFILGGWDSQRFSPYAMPASEWVPQTPRAPCAPSVPGEWCASCAARAWSQRPPGDAGWIHQRPSRTTGKW